MLFCGRDMHYGYAFTREEGARWSDTSSNGRVQVIQCDRDQVDEVIGDAHVIVPLMCRLDRPRLEKAKRARLIIQYGAGVEGVDAQAAADMGIALSNIPSRDTGNAESCAEMSIFLMLATLRQIRDMEESIRTRRLGVPCGRMLKGSTVCIVGNGNISKALRPRLRGFGVSQCVLTRRVQCELHDDSDVSDWSEVRSSCDGGALLRSKGWPLALTNFRLLTFQVTDDDGMSRILGKSDIVVFACAVNTESLGMMNEEFLRRCKAGVIIINVARGGLLDYKATKKGLECGTIGGMGLVSCAPCRGLHAHSHLQPSLGR